MLKGRAQSWQMDPDSIQTESVQLWSATGVMLSGMLSKEEARKLVSSGKCFVMSEQAIGYYDTMPI